MQKVEKCGIIGWGDDTVTDILIVEDNKELSKLLTDFLRAEGYTVSAVDSGDRALQLFERYGARLVVLEIFPM